MSFGLCERGGGGAQWLLIQRLLDCSLASLFYRCLVLLQNTCTDFSLALGPFVSLFESRGQWREVGFTSSSDLVSRAFSCRRWWRGWFSRGPAFLFLFLSLLLFEPTESR
eukprot:RCo017287